MPDTPRDRMRKALGDEPPKRPSPADLFTRNSDIVSRSWDYVEGGKSGYSKKQVESMERLGALWMTKQPYPGAAAVYKEAWLNIMRHAKHSQEDDLSDVFDWKAWRDDYFKINP